MLRLVSAVGSAAPGRHLHQGCRTASLASRKIASDHRCSHQRACIASSAGRKAEAIAPTAANLGRVPKGRARESVVPSVFPSVAGAAWAAAAAGVAVAVSIACGSAGAVGDEQRACLCRGQASAEDSLKDYVRRLQRLQSVRDIFDEYATVNAEGVGKLMTCGDFLRAMLCYRYVRVDGRELKRRCARYVNPLLGDIHGLISFHEFCFLLSLVTIPAGLLDVAFVAADSDGSGTIDRNELETLVERLAPTGNVKGDEASSGPQLVGHKRLAAAWFGEDEKGTVPRERFAEFVRDLRLDVKAVECRLYSRFIPPDEGAAKEKQPTPPTAEGASSWWPWSWKSLGGGGGGEAKGEGEGTYGAGISKASSADEPRDGGWWKRYEHETISMADLALTLISSCHPRDIPVLLERVQAIRKKRDEIPLNDALLLHEVLEDNAQDLEDALALYSKASSGGAVEMGDFTRAAKVVSGKDLNQHCVWVVFKMFDSAGNMKLKHEELLEAIHDRLRRLPGQRDSPSRLARFVQCARGDH